MGLGAGPRGVGPGVGVGVGPLRGVVQIEKEMGVAPEASGESRALPPCPCPRSTNLWKAWCSRASCCPCFSGCTVATLGSPPLAGRGLRSSAQLRADVCRRSCGTITVVVVNRRCGGSGWKKLSPPAAARSRYTISFAGAPRPPSGGVWARAVRDQFRNCLATAAFVSPLLKSNRAPVKREE